MNRLWVVVLGVTFLIPSLAGVCPAAGEKPAAFTALKDAVAFIAGCLDKGDFDRLAASCSNAARPATKNALESLKRTHEKTPLPKLYEGKEFPADKDAFKLGGHMSELGFIHIDFVRKDGAWCLDSIWMCR
jgi:hypothetical protein